MPVKEASHFPVQPGQKLKALNGTEFEVAPGFYTSKDVMEQVYDVGTEDAI